MVAVGGSSCVIIDSTLLARVNGALVVNVTDTLLLADVDGSLLDDVSGWLLANVTLLADVDGLLWSDNRARCVPIIYIIDNITRPICITWNCTGRALSSMWCDCYNGVASFPFFSFLFCCTYLPITFQI